jgi:hypothetical protein
MNIRIFKISTGEDVIAEVAVTDEAYIKVKNPMVVMIRQDPNTGQMKAGMIPFAPFSDSDTVNIYAHAVVSSYDAAQDILNEYNRIFGSGIVVANQMPVGKV